MAFVWLRREDCETDNLPNTCTCCGRPATHRVAKDFRATLVWSNPFSVFGAERWTVRLPTCERHRRYWRRRAWILAAGWLMIALPPCSLLSVLVAPEVLDSSFLMGSNLPELLPLLCCGMWYPLAFMAFVSQTGIHAVEIHENAIRLVNVHVDFARTYEMRDELSLDLDRAVGEGWRRRPAPPAGPDESALKRSPSEDMKPDL